VVTAELIQRLEQKGWKIKLKPQPGLNLKPEFTARYPDMTAEHRAFLETVQSAVSSDGKAYFLCEDDYNQKPGAAYEWNCWETLSLDSSKDDPTKQENVRIFWTAHLPIFHSVKSDFAYLAVKQNDTTAGRVFYGSEPEFEEINFICESFGGLLEGLAGGAFPQRSARILQSMI